MKKIAMHTEEDIKTKLLIPWLKSLGFAEDELKFEDSFSLHVGRYTVRVDTNEQIKTAQPRSDILVTRNGKNLFIIEAKTDAKNLTDEDRDQAVSYARLVHPMAPLAIVTNGRDFRIYKSGDKQEIQKEKSKLLDYKIDSGMETLYGEAFEYFISYSKDNVAAFCNAQIIEGMKTLLGSKEKPDRRFIPELYVSSKRLKGHINIFLNDDKPVFTIIGESGSGKTCAMCGLAIELSRDYPVLFYRATNLTEGIVKSIANDFNWEFSPQYSDIALFKRINLLFKDKRILIFIDGLDEWTLPNKVEVLGDFASKIKDKNFKLITSCKSGQWDNLLINSGIPTSFSEEIFSIADSKTKGYSIEPFVDEEFYALIKKYRAFYEFEGTFESDVLKACKQLPFLLRVFFEVAQKNKYLHLTFSIKEFYDKYYETLLAKVPDNQEVAQNIIKSIARVLFEYNSETVEMGTLRKELGLSITEPIMPSLFELNILERTGDGLDPKIGFYFKKFRDYIIAFGVMKWDKQPLDEFERDQARLNLKDVQLDAIKFFYPFASKEKKRLFDGLVRANAEAYLDLYVKVLDEHFPNLRHRFSPQTNGKIGFIGGFDIRNKKITVYSFRPINEVDETIELVPCEGSFWNSSADTLYMLGAKYVHYRGSSKGFNDVNIRKEVLESEIHEQLKKIVDAGLLNEAQNYYLALEKVLGIVVSKQSKFHGIKDSLKLSQYLPISIEKIEYGLRYEKASRYFNDQLVNDKIAKGIIKPIWQGSTKSYSFSQTRDDHELIHKQAHESALAKIDYKTYDVDLRKVDEALNEALATLKKRKDTIDEVILPNEDALPTGSARFMHDLYKKETLVSFVQRLYTLFLEEYKTLVEINFPTLKAYFNLYSKMPAHFFVIVNFEVCEDPIISVYKCINDTNKNEVTLCTNQDVTFDPDEFITYKGSNYKVFTSQITTFPAFERKGFTNIRIPSEFTVLRHLVYEQIEEELPTAFEHLSL